ncbi:MAG: sulfatase [Firmicutes bacterium]|nr:sulfatase [Bacillota bacterium]
MKAIMILADSVNRRYLSAYGNDWVKTPNLERLQEKCVVFDNHWTGSAPCMPARRDIMTGRLNFLDRNWGAIEPFDRTLPDILREQNLFTHMVTDHYHYLEIGGENYCQLFNTWECFRGQENDVWVSKVNYEPETAARCGRYVPQYELNRTKFLAEADYPTPKTLQAAAHWLEENKEADNYLLWVEVFDPHEPFDTPDDYLAPYEDHYDGPLYNWPKYAPVKEPEEAVTHIRNRYAATLTMTDKWLGKILDVMDQNNMWEDTMVIFMTDHGYMLGEHGFMAKIYMPAYNEVFHIPLMIHYPGDVDTDHRVKALTQNIDILPTVLDYFGISRNRCRNKLHGKSLIPLLKGETESIREYALYGYFGKSVNITDGKYTYFRASVREDNLPLYLYTAMPTTLCQYYGLNTISDFKKIETGRYLKWTDYPVYKIPAEIIESQRFNQRSQYNGEHLLFDIEKDYGQHHMIQDEQVEKVLMEKMKKAVMEYEAPEEQLIRLGLV